MRRMLGIRFVAVAAGALAFTPLLLAAEPAIAPGTDFGAGLSLERVIDLAEVVRDPDQYAKSPILLSGRISEVCQRKGCWTVLSQGDSSVRVRFKDYGFFLPIESSGKRAYVEGVVTSQMLSEKSARHYARESKGGDAGAIREISGPQREIGFTASGVRLVDD